MVWVCGLIASPPTAPTTGSLRNLENRIDFDDRSAPVERRIGSMRSRVYGQSLGCRERDEQRSSKFRIDLQNSGVLRAKRPCPVSSWVDCHFGETRLVVNGLGARNGHLHDLLGGAVDDCQGSSRRKVSQGSHIDPVMELINRDVDGSVSFDSHIVLMSAFHRR